MTDAFTGPGRFFRGNLHGHSDASDGALPVAEVCRRYAAQGYDFTCVTDHFVGAFGYPISDARAHRTNRFTTIPGAELHSGAMSNGELWHILAVGLPEDFAPSNSPGFVPVAGQETGAQIAQRARDAGAFVAIAHPHWSGLTPEDARTIKAAHAVEVYNHGCAIECDRGDGAVIADLLLTEGRRLNLIATDDSHFRIPDGFGGWVMVRAEENDPDALLAALKAGAYYSSQGPDFVGIDMGANAVEVASSAVRSICLQGPGSAAMHLMGDSLTRATVPLGRLEDAPWFRITLIDHAGRRAWSNPIWR